MKATPQRRASALRCSTQLDNRANELGLLAQQLAEVRALNEKLLYRVQQLERREKNYRTSLASLRRHINAAVRQQTPAPVRRKTPDAVEPAAQNNTHVTPKRQGLQPDALDFSTALDDLN